VTPGYVGGDSRRGAPPRDALFARRVGEPQQQIAVTWLRRAEAQQILASKLVDRTQQVAGPEPAGMLGDHCCTIAIDADPKRIAPLAAASDIDRAIMPAGRVLG